MCEGNSKHILEIPQDHLSKESKTDTIDNIVGQYGNQAQHDKTKIGSIPKLDLRSNR